MMWTSFFCRPSSSGHARQSFFVYSCPAVFKFGCFVSPVHLIWCNHFCVHHATVLFCPITVTNWRIDVILRELTHSLFVSIILFCFVLYCKWTLSYAHSDQTILQFYVPTRHRLFYIYFIPATGYRLFVSQSITQSEDRIYLIKKKLKKLRTNVAKDWAKLEMVKQNLPPHFVCS